MTGPQIHDALTEVRAAVPVPPLDEVAFRSRLRGERRRRTAGRAALAGAVATVVAASVALVGAVGLHGPAGAERRVDPGPARRPAAVGGLSGTVFFVLGGHLTALDPAGRVHDLGVRSEGVVGFTSERVYASVDSHVVVFRVTRDDGGRTTIREETSPVPEPVQRAALSGDGRYLAWTGLDDVTHRFDLKADREDLTLPGGPLDSVVDVAQDGVLLAEGRRLVLRGADSAVSVPVAGDGYGVASQVALGRVLVNDRDGRSRLYDVSGGTARLVETFGGPGALGPYAARVGVIVPDPSDVPDRSVVEVWDGRSTRPVTGLHGAPDTLRWAGEDTLLVAAHDGTQGALYACDAQLACHRLPVDGEVGLSR